VPARRRALIRPAPFEAFVRRPVRSLLGIVGGLIAGLVARWAPEVAGGGGDAMIDSFHDHGGSVRRRVILAKPLASIATLGFGGAGGREGPTMQFGAAIGAWTGSVMPTSARERRILMIAGVAAGIAAVFPERAGASPARRVSTR
jgi:chloride channel protein, CIC family